MSFLNKIAAIKPRDLEHIFNSEGMDGIIRLQKKGKINKQVFEQFVNKIKGLTLNHYSIL